MAEAEEYRLPLSWAKRFVAQMLTHDAAPIIEEDSEQDDAGAPLLGIANRCAVEMEDDSDDAEKPLRSEAHEGSGRPLPVNKADLLRHFF